MQSKYRDIPDAQTRLRIARERCERPSLYPGDIVKARRRGGQSRDDRLFVILEVKHRLCHYYYDDPGSHNGEDCLRIKEYKKKNAKVRVVMRKHVWFTGKQLSL